MVEKLIAANCGCQYEVRKGSYPRLDSRCVFHQHLAEHVRKLCACLAFGAALRTIPYLVELEGNPNLWWQPAPSGVGVK